MFIDQGHRKIQTPFRRGGMMLDEYHKLDFRPSERRWKPRRISAAINMSPLRGETDGNLRVQLRQHTSADKA
jgi:hypothetical protein